jgi:hypothetical protein
MTTATKAPQRRPQEKRASSDRVRLDFLMSVVTGMPLLGEG